MYLSDKQRDKCLEAVAANYKIKRENKAKLKIKLIGLYSTITELPEHFPTKMALLQNVQPTSAAVERCFSILKKLLRLGRNCIDENVFSYLIMMYNYPK